MTTITHTPVTGARGLLWLAEAARDVGVELHCIRWDAGPWQANAATAPHWAAHVDGRDDLDRLGDRLGLAPAIEGRVVARTGRWADMDVTIVAYTGADR